MIVFSMGILFLLISPVRARATGGSHGMPFLAIFCFMECVQAAIETKTLSLFYGNSVLYSVMILVLNTAFPCFFLLYYENRFELSDRKGFTPLIILSVGDILVQILLQLFGVRDFLEMATFTHGVIAIVLLFVGFRFLSAFRRTRDRRYLLELFALSFFSAGVLIDVVRSMVIKVGDFVEFTRMGTAVYTVILAYVHISEAIRENDALLQDNYRLMEKQLAFEKAEVARAEEERDEADRKSDAKSRFLASMSHEIRTPINTILGMNTMILRESTEQPVREYAGNVDSAAKNLLSLINDILDFSKIESGRVELVPVDFSMSSLINDVAVMIRGRAEAKNLSFKLEADPELPEKGHGEETRIKQVMVNILTNAVKYTPEGTVTFTVRRKDASPLTPGLAVPVEIRVEDTGMGIKSENLDRIFDSFQRVDERKNRSIEGTGLGLAITKQITELMGGEISVTSEYCKGSVFTVTLPITVLGTEKVGDLSKRISETAGSNNEAQAGLYAPAVKIYVDDELRYTYSMNDSPFTYGYTTTGLLFVDLRQQDEGRWLRIESTSDTSYRGYVDQVYYGDRAGILMSYFRAYGAEVILAILLLIFGLALVVISLVMEVRLHAASELKFLALGVVFFAGWSLTENCYLRQFIIPHVDVASFAAFIFKFLMPLPFMCYIDEVQKRRYHRIFLLMEGMDISASFLCFILHVTGIMSYIYSVPVIVILIGGSILTVVGTVVRDIVQKSLDYKLIGFGLGVFFVTSLFSLPSALQGSGNMNETGVLLGLMALSVIAILKAVMDAEKAKEEKKEALALSDSKSRFLASMSHEIRTPINTVLGMNEMIERECTDDKILSYADNIGTAGRMLLSIINDILDFSKIESGKMELSIISYQTASVINDCVTLLKKRADEKGLRMILSCDKALPSALFGDDVRVKQIITNILTNAVKYTEKGSVTLTVAGEIIPVEEQKDGQDYLLRVSVRDTGIVIKAEAMDDLFTDFSRMDQTKNRHIEGTGLGLSITKLLLEVMGGSIHVQSVYGEGSEFSVEIPQKISDERPMGDLEKQSTSVQAEKKKYEPSFTAPEAHILVVDDNKMNRVVFTGLLKQTEMKIDQAAGGMEALEMTRKQKYNIIFMDHMMPELDGIETLKRIRAEETNPNRQTATIALTANAIAGIDRMYRDSGFQDYLAKPVQPVKLERMIINYLPKDLVKKRDPFED